jgi:hypothetical protein
MTVPDISFEKQREAILLKIEQLQNAKFWGEMILTLRGGDLKMTKVSQTIPTEKLVATAERIAQRRDA